MLACTRLQSMSAVRRARRRAMVTTLLCFLELGSPACMHASPAPVLFANPRALCTTSCAPRDVRLSWQCDPSLVDHFFIRLNREGCSWFDAECGDLSVQEPYLKVSDICTLLGDCEVLVAIEPNATYRWTSSVFLKDRPGEPSPPIHGVPVSIGISFVCASTPDAHQARTEPFASMGALHCAAQTENQQGLQPKKPSEDDTTMDPRHWLSLFEELHNPLTRSAADSRAWMATFVRPSACTFRNVAADDKYTYIFVTDPVLRVRYEEQGKHCAYESSLARTQDLLRGHNGKSEPWCYCFHRERLPRFVDPRTFRANCASSRAWCGHSYGLEQYHRAHHWGHYVEGVGMLHALLVAAANTSAFQPHSTTAAENAGKEAGGSVWGTLGEFRRLSLFKIPSLLGTERQMLDAALSALSPQQRHTLMNPSAHVYGTAFHSSSPLHWYEQLTHVAATRAIAYTEEQASSLREAAYNLFGWHPPRHQRCHPLRCALLYRPPAAHPSSQDSERRMSNEDEVEDAMKRGGCASVTRNFVSGDLSLEEQASFFRGTNLIVSSHSSQLLGMIFSAPGSHVIEAFPITVNPDFAYIGGQLGLQYFFAWGGEAQFEKPTAQLQKVMVWMNECGGTFECFRRIRSFEAWDLAAAAHYFKYSAAQQFYTANTTAIEMRVADAIRAHWSKCEGHSVSL